MALPDFQTLMRPLLRLMAEGRGSVAACLPDLIDQFGIDEADASEIMPTGTMTRLAHRAHWARTYLGKAGLLRSPKRGRHEATERGLEVLGRNEASIDIEYLMQFDEFREWREANLRRHRRRPPRDAREAASQTLTDTTEKSEETALATPEDRLQAAAQEIEAALADEVLAACLDTSPARFERLIVDLLIAMGYGRGDPARGRATQLSADGGIDGVVNEDALGLDAVYVQAKRYAPENTVGRPDIQRFVGAMHGEGASKGVFVTTSAFSREAGDYVRTVAQRIVLIDGARLARLMIAHGVGVRTRRVVELRDIDDAVFRDA